MSSSIAIPKRKKNSGHGNNACSPASSSSLSSSASARSPVASPSSSTPSDHHYYRPDRRPSLLKAQQAHKARVGSSISKSEHTVINVGHPDAPRLITCVKASQGFDWNQDIFLPSYADYESSELERRQDPVQDIILTDEEVASMFPSSS
ncbi:hypothetical protein GTA08_BOTSDO10572 [Botryosphaeria dothidea]|uniref:Uncharacterized protein n=1 Tax=Botryosphaeria dothidea TaxID=55169 RepID=A0A8H4IIU6_9PEZI|nr:hypothetical protein GTA08_BOTSDO10572 [Botryosphaeria dothidea]